MLNMVLSLGPKTWKEWIVFGAIIVGLIGWLKLS
jgi:hypothetical protein